MARKRIYQVAREFKLSSEALLGMLRGMGLAAKSHMSAIDDETVEALKAKLREEKEAVKREVERKKQMAEERKAKARAKAKKEEEAKKAQQPPPRRKLGMRRRVADEKSVKESVRKTLADIGGAKKPRRRRRRARTEAGKAREESKRIRVTEFVSVGELSAVEPELLLYAWEAVVADGPDNGAELLIEWRPADQRCATCGEAKERASGSWMRLCPDCGMPLEVSGGAELDILDLSFEAAEAVAEGGAELSD